MTEPALPEPDFYIATEARRFGMHMAFKSLQNIKHGQDEYEKAVSMETARTYGATCRAQSEAEIARLRDALKDIVQVQTWWGANQMATTALMRPEDLARAALATKED